MAGSVGNDRKLVVWRLLDGKPGHENQTLGLVSALEQHISLDCHDIPAGRVHHPLLNLLSGSFTVGKALPDPDLILGAGHATHLPMLAARRARGGKVVVLMKPSLPLSLFDLCIIPEHDNPPPRSNVMATRGVLNPVRPDPGVKRDRLLILLGGPSKSHGWDSDTVVEQVQRLVEANAGARILASDSRRTPAGLIKRLQEQVAGIECVSHADTPRGWVADQLIRSHTAWISEDSVSMVYEALTAGCRVGLIEVPRLSDGRVARGVTDLRQSGLLVTYSDWLHGQGVLRGNSGFDEAARVAERLISDKLLNMEK